MSGINLLADTNVLINLAEGKKNIDVYLQGNLVYVSVISEMELFGHHGISQKEINFFESMLRQCTVIELIRPVKELTIKLRQANKIKLPDAIIAASAIYLDAPLLTSDREFSKIKNLDLIIVE